MWISEIRYQDPLTQTFLGSPSIVRLPNDEILVTHDYFGPGAPRDHEGKQCLTSVYTSKDNGLHWENVTHLVGAFWSGLFVHGDAVYLLGTSSQEGSIVIRRSTDYGRTWTHPADEKSGLLFKGGPGRVGPNYHCAPVPVIEVQGRLYRAFEDIDPPIFARGFQSLVISCPADADLLNAANWRMSNKLVYDQDADPPDWGGTAGAGWLEGNVVETPQGEIWNILRNRTTPVVNKATVVRVFDEGRRVSCDPFDYVHLPGAKTKFTIRRDPQTGRYWTLTNNVVHPDLHWQRNYLSLYFSDDLRQWTYVKTLMADSEGLSEEEAAQQIGYQYVDWQFDGSDIIYVVRVAWRGADNFHNSNRIAFARIDNFRSLVGEKG